MGYSPLWISVSSSVNGDAQAACAGPALAPQYSPSLFRNCFSRREKQTASESKGDVNLVDELILECLFFYCEKNHAHKIVQMLYK